MAYEDIPDDVRAAMTAELAGPFTASPGTPEYEQEVETRIEASNAHLFAWQAERAAAEYADLIGAGFPESTARRISGHTGPTLTEV